MAIYVSDAMRDAGLARYDEIRESFPDFLLVVEIYIAMEEARLSETSANPQRANAHKDAT